MDRCEAKMVLDATLSEGGGHRLRSGKGIEFAADLLCAKFGGFTSHQVLGCWKHPGTGEHVWDTGIAFNVAISTGPGADQAWIDFKDAAIILAWPQETVYVVDPYGYVEVLDVPRILVQRGASEASLDCGQPSNSEREVPTAVDCEKEADPEHCPGHAVNCALRPHNFKVDDVMELIKVPQQYLYDWKYEDAPEAVQEGQRRAYNARAVSISDAHERAIFRLVVGLLVAAGLLITYAGTIMP